MSGYPSMGIEKLIFELTLNDGAQWMRVGVDEYGKEAIVRIIEFPKFSEDTYKKRISLPVNFPSQIRLNVANFGVDNILMGEMKYFMGKTSEVIVMDIESKTLTLRVEPDIEWLGQEFTLYG